MKSTLLVSLALLALLFTGCASKVIDSAATKVKLGSAEITLAKNIKAEQLIFRYNPETKQIEFTVAKIESDASGVIDSASKIQAEALGKLADTVTALAPLTK